MEDPPTIGHRELNREFESDRHSAAVLAKVFEALGRFVDSSPVLSNSVQSQPSETRKLLLQEER